MKAESWEDLLNKWRERLILDSAWEIDYISDPSLAARAQTSTNAPNRCATISFNCDMIPRNNTSCHEIVHVLTSRFDTAGCRLAIGLPENMQETAKHLFQDAIEEVTEVLTEVLLKAYDET